MSRRNVHVEPSPVPKVNDVLTELLREDACEMFASVMHAEVREYIEKHAHMIDQEGRRLVVRNSLMPERTILTGVGAIPVLQSRVNDHRMDSEGNRIRFSNRILPPYLRKTRTIEDLLPWLYLKGISTGDFPEALNAKLGADVPGLSPNTIVRLKQVWRDEFQCWSQRSLKDMWYVSFWIDSVSLSVRLGEDQRQCLLVIIGATEDCKKELVAILNGVREGEQSWHEVLLEVKRRDLLAGPEIAVGDGALRSWKALIMVFPRARTQRCWVHKTGNALNCPPKSKQPLVKQQLHEVRMAETRKSAKAFEYFLATNGPAYPKAAECLAKDRAVLLAFCDFPAEHWVHRRTSNSIESTFATVRPRTNMTKRSGSRNEGLTGLFMLVQLAEQRWRALTNASLLKDVINGVQFKDCKKDAA